MNALKLFCYKRSIAILLSLFGFTPFALADEYFALASGKTALEFVNGEIRVSLVNGGCEKGFEAACTNTEQRSEYVETNAHSSGDRVAYSWQIMVPEGFDENPYAPLRATRFLVGENDPILYFILDVEHGYEVGHKTCFGPNGYGTWHSVEMRVAWDSTRKQSLSDKTPGEIHVFCDGIEIFSRLGRPNLGEGNEVRVAFGLTAPLGVPESGNFLIFYRGLDIGTW